MTEPDDAETALLIVSLALSPDVPLLSSFPSLATKTLGAELIPVAPVLTVTLSPITTLEFVIVTIPVVIVLLSPSMVTDARPTVKSPTILALPSTYSAVFPTPPIVVVL